MKSIKINYNIFNHKYKVYPLTPVHRSENNKKEKNEEKFAEKLSKKKIKTKNKTGGLK